MRVVIVDDTPINLTLMGHLVKKVGDYEVLTFQSPVAGLAWCQENDFDLLIIDFTMPVMDGLMFIEALQQQGLRDAPILMVTANHDRDVRHQALANGARDFLTKPIDNLEFMARIRNMLALRESTQALKNRAAWLDAEVQKATAAILAREQETIVLLCRASEYRDPETGAHILRMAHYSKLIAAGFGMSPAEQEAILIAAPMHDIGKVGTPDHILLKPGRLDPDEMAIMKEHAQNGYNILCESSAENLQLGALIALSHHEKFDGSGYPKGLSGEDIPLVGRIVAVADVFDALTSARPYKKAWSLDAARDYLETQRGTHFDPRCVDLFLKAWDDVLRIRETFSDPDELIDPEAEDRR